MPTSQKNRPSKKQQVDKKESQPEGSDKSPPNLKSEKTSPHPTPPPRKAEEEDNELGQYDVHVTGAVTVRDGAGHVFRIPINVLIPDTLSASGLENADDEFNQVVNAILYRPLCRHMRKRVNEELEKRDSSQDDVPSHMPRMLGGYDMSEGLTEEEEEDAGEQEMEDPPPQVKEGKPTGEQKNVYVEKDEQDDEEYKKI